MRNILNTVKRLLMIVKTIILGKYLFSSSDESIRFLCSVPLCLLPLLTAPLPPRPLRTGSGSLTLLLGTSIKHQNYLLVLSISFNKLPK